MGCGDGGDGAGATPRRHLGSVVGRDEKTAKKGATAGMEKPSRGLFGVVWGFLGWRMGKGWQVPEEEEGGLGTEPARVGTQKIA